MSNDKLWCSGKGQDLLMKKRKMILITDYYPFSTGETFLENEVPYLAENFDLIILTSDLESAQTRAVPNGVTIYRIDAKQGYSFWEKCKYTAKFLCTRIGWQEIFEILATKTKIRTRLLSSLYFFVEAESFLRQVDAVAALQPEEDTIVYSYWANYKLLAFVNKKKRAHFKLVSRFHGYDLYNERYQDGRQPFKNQMDEALDAGLFVSEAGYNYYNRRFKVKNPSIHHLFRLGTNTPQCIPEKQQKHRFLLCSCSNVIPLKRVELIVEALKQLGDYPLRWVHFGDGNKFEAVQRLAMELPEQVHYELKGRVGNHEVLDFYSKNYVDCFITTSQTEGGCPVSIMEAISYGVPIVATSVGGIPEMLRETPNILLPEDPEIALIADAIKQIYSMTEEKTNEIRQCNMERWRSAFSQEQNNNQLIEFLLTI